MSKSGFTFDLSQLSDLATSLGRAQGLGDDKALLHRFNEVVDEVYDTARGRMIRGINLTDQYLRSRMEVTHATAGRGLQAEIRARGGPGDQTPLGRYLQGVTTAPAPRAKGSPSRGVPAGRKATGVAVQVTRGAPKNLPGAFTMPLKKGAEVGGNGVGIFLRTKYGLVRHRYGPAPYQLFRVFADEAQTSTGDTLEQRLSPFAVAALERILA